MLTPLVSETLIFLVSLVFNLIYHRDIQSGMLLVFRNDSARQMAKDILKDIQVNTSIYFGTLTVVNICLGIAATVLTWLVGLPHPFLPLTSGASIRGNEGKTWRRNQIASHLVRGGSCVGVDRPCGHDVGRPPNAANDTAVPIPTDAIYRAQHLDLF